MVQVRRTGVQHPLQALYAGFTGRNLARFTLLDPAANTAEAMAAVADGSIKLDVETYPLDRAADTHARMEAGGVSGRLVLTAG